MNNIIKILFCACVLVICFNNIYAADELVNETSEKLNLNNLIENLDKYTEDSELAAELDLSNIARNLITGKSNDYSKVIQKIIDFLAGETITVTKNAISILIMIVVMGIFNSLEIDKKSQVNDIVYLVCFVIISTILANMYLGVISDYTKTITGLSSIMQTVTPFVMIVMIASGGIVSSNLIQPIILFIASLVGFLVNYIVIPFVTISIVMKIVSMMSKNIRLNKLGELFSKSSLWITAVVFTMFLSVISVKGSMTTSVDSAVVKTTQTAVSNFIPVVGKFVSDSLESIMGATEIIGKAAGVIGIIVMLAVSALPIIQMVVIFVAHKILVALSETIVDNKNLIGLIDSFAETYKILLGVLIGIIALFVMSSGVLIKLIGSIT